MCFTKYFSLRVSWYWFHCCGFSKSFSPHLFLFVCLGYWAAVWHATSQQQPSSIPTVCHMTLLLSSSSSSSAFSSSSLFSLHYLIHYCPSRILYNIMSLLSEDEKEQLRLKPSFNQMCPKKIPRVSVCGVLVRVSYHMPSFHSCPLFFSQQFVRQGTIGIKSVHISVCLCK